MPEGQADHSISNDPSSTAPSDLRRRQGKSLPEPPGEAITMTQLLELVEKACAGDKALSRQLFSAFMQMRLRPTTPANERALAEVLIRVLIGERTPSLSELEAEDIAPVREMLQRLVVSGA
jgi:hypothetical protein